MAPRRNNHAALGTAVQNEVQGPAGIDSEVADGGGPQADATHCCVPAECLRPGKPIPLDDLRDTVRVTCNNDQCTAGRFMHRECFEAWEQTVLTYLKSCGRARSWSERQRHQNLWTKKGYDLAYKACGCNCGRGHLKKDLDWAPPPPGFGAGEDEGARRKKRRNKHPQQRLSPSDLRARTGSLSSSAGSSSPPASASSVSPIHSTNNLKKKSKIDFFSDR
ncbi:hypothetical protein AAG570_006832 [Ranatra chinensis]|uniref:Headcase N-terminal domain-containing protein n=1 Tax=Ranatra chinensis TaxID=642074 RepID=A0ABD0YVG3_9HEMI